MAYSTVLGRDFMNICNFKIVRENDCSNDSFANDSSNDSFANDCSNDSCTNDRSNASCADDGLNDSGVDDRLQDICSKDSCIANDRSDDSNSEKDSSFTIYCSNVGQIGNDCATDSREKDDCLNDSIKVYCGYKETQSDSCKMIESSQDLSVQPSDHFESEIMSIEYPDPAECNLLNISDKCAFTLRKKLIDIFDRFYTKPKRPEIPLVKWETKLNFYTTKPFNYPPRRLSYAEKSQVQNLLYGYIKNGIIRVSKSEYASPIVLVKKKSGQLRMCVDYQTLNKNMLKDNYPTPLIDDLIDKLSEKTNFTKLDLKSGFFHVHMHEDSIKYTAFTTPMGQYEWLRMPFGLRNAPAVFQRFVNKIFADLVKEDKVLIYMDDILIATKDSKSHMEILTEVFRRLVDNKLELRLDKCEFLQREIKYLGYISSGEGIKPDSKGMQAVKDFPVPTKTHDVQSFLRLCSYFRRFVKDFSTKAKPLYDLVRKDRKFEFGAKEFTRYNALESIFKEYSSK